MIHASGYSSEEPQPVWHVAFLMKPCRFIQLREALEGFGVAMRPTM